MTRHEFKCPLRDNPEGNCCCGVPLQWRNTLVKPKTAKKTVCADEGLALVKIGRNGSVKVLEKL